MAEAYKKTKLINTNGSSGTYIGFFTGVAQTVQISGPFVYGITGGPGVSGSLALIDIVCAANALVPVNCTFIKPGTGNCIGFMS